MLITVLWIKRVMYVRRGVFPDGLHATHSRHSNLSWLSLDHLNHYLNCVMDNKVKPHTNINLGDSEELFSVTVK